MQKIKIIIPSIGRTGLVQTLKNISLDSLKLENEEIEVLLVSDGAAAFETNDAVISAAQIPISLNFTLTHLLNPGKGVSAALNFGLTYVNTEDLFMIFTDDDDWLSGRIEILANAIVHHPTADVLLSRALVKNENGSDVRPDIQISANENILKYLYAKRPLQQNLVYFSLVTMIAKGKVAKINFRKELTSHEDVVWLSDLQAEKFYIDGVTEVTANLNVSLSRSASRMNDGADQLFLEWFKSEDLQVFSNYIWVHAQRANSSEGNVRFLLKSFARNFKVLKPNISQLLISVCQICFALYQKIKKAVL